jgi:hypothetical protein
MGKRDRLVSPADVPEVFAPFKPRHLTSFLAVGVALLFAGVFVAGIAAAVTRAPEPGLVILVLVGLLFALVPVYMLYLILKAQAVLISQVSQMAEISRVNQDLMIMQVDRRENDNSQQP